MALAKAKVKRFSFTGVTVWNVKLPKGGVLQRHHHTRSYLVHPLRPGRVKVIYYPDATATQSVREETRDLVPGEPYEVNVPPDGVWIEIVNDGDDTDWDKDEPDPRP